MSEFLYIYLYTTLLGFSGFAKTIVALGIIAGLISAVFWVFALMMGEDDEDINRVTTVFKSAAKGKWVITSWVVLLLLCMVPTKDDMKIIIGGGLALKATQIEGIRKLPQRLVNVMDKFLETYEEAEK